MLLDIKQTKKEEEYIQSMQYASEIQKGLLPKKRHFDKMNVQYSIYFKPHSILSGDFYWLGKKNEYFYLVVGDCTGHGIPASLLTVMGISLLNYIVLGKDYNDLGDYLKELDKKWIETFHSDQENFLFNNDWMEMVLVKISPNDLIIEISGAYLPIIIKKNNGELIECYTNKFPIGGWQIESERIYKSQKIKLNKGDEIYLFTDGILDQFGGDKSKRFGKQRLKQFIKEVEFDDINEKIMLFKETLATWQGQNPLTDDQTLIALKF
jgi:serine phosphatase RsbU (regulator of sigma subunit)